MAIELRERLSEALDDEYKSRATYRCVIEKFGPVRPFVNIVEAEQRHVYSLISLFDTYGLPVLEDDWASRVVAPATIGDACRAAVEAERANMAMYDRLLAATPEPDVRRVLSQLQSASRDRHLPAFERCVARRPEPMSDGAGLQRPARGQRRCGSRVER
ncbi:ferritin-like domain-containing protein [Methylolobus aquaticus]